MRVETLCARKLLTADSGQEPALQHTGGATIPAQHSNPIDPLRLDVNHDGVLEPVDALQVVNAIADGLLADQAPQNDVNQDQQINSADFDAVIQALDDQDIRSYISNSQTGNQAASANVGGSTELTSACDALEVTLALLEEHLQDLVDGGASQEAIENVEASIAALHDQINDCGDDGSGSEGITSGTTAGSSSGSTSGTTNGSTAGTTTGSTTGSTDQSTGGTTTGTSSGTTVGTTSGTTGNATSSTTSGTTSGTTSATAGFEGTVIYTTEPDESNQTKTFYIPVGWGENVYATEKDMLLLFRAVAWRVPANKNWGTPAKILKEKEYDANPSTPERDDPVPVDIDNY